MKNGDIALSYLNSFASGDAAAIAEHVTEDFRNVQVGELGRNCVGADTYRSRLVEFLGAFRNLQYEIEDLIVDGDNVAASYRMTFTQDQRPVVISGVMILTIRNDRIAMRKDYWDGLSYQKQVNATEE